MAKILKRRGNNIEAGRRGGLAAMDISATLFQRRGREEERISLSLMVALGMIVRDEFSQGPTE